MSDPQNRATFRPQYSPQFSLGNIITIAFGIIAMAVAWGQVSNRMATAESDVEQNRVDIAQNATRIRTNELSITRQDERTNSILSGLARIEGQLMAIDKRLNSRIHDE